jgi:hypothetical protein
MNRIMKMTEFSGLKRLAAAMTMLSVLPLTNGAFAQDKFEASIGADVVNKYVWRGFNQNSGVSVQPSLSLAYKGFSIGAWGSTSVTELEAKEFDLSVGYEVGGFGISVTDYWWNGESCNYGNYKSDHFFEAALSYNFGEKFPLTVSVATMFAGGDKNAKGNQAYSTYFNASYDIACPKGITLTPSVGATTKTLMYTDKEVKGVTDISLKAARDFALNDRFTIPVFVQVTVSPRMDKTYLVCGMSFAM